MDIVYVIVSGNEIKPMQRAEVTRQMLWFETREEAVAFILACAR